MSDRVAYVDNCVVSRIADPKSLQPTTATALGRLADFVEFGNLRFITSHKTRAEILQTPEPTREAVLHLVFALMDKTRFRVLEYSPLVGAAPVGVTPVGAGWTDPLLAKLRSLSLFDDADAEHV